MLPAKEDLRRLLKQIFKKPAITILQILIFNKQYPIILDVKLIECYVFALYYHNTEKVFDYHQRRI